MKENLERLKEKIRNKPKLYKFLKIFRIIFNFVAYIFAIFFVLSLSIASCDNSNKQVLAYGDYNNAPLVKKSNYFQEQGVNNGSYYGNISEWCNGEYFNNKLYSAMSNLNQYWNSSVSTSSLNNVVVVNVSGFYIGLPSYSIYGEPDDNYTISKDYITTNYSQYLVSQIVVSGCNEVIGDNTWYYRRYLRFYYANGNPFYDIDIFANYGFVNMTHSGSVLNCGYFADTNFTLGDTFYVDNDTTDDVNEAYYNGYENGYTNGTRVGSNEGYTLGYEEGHSAGYSEGYTAGSEVDTTTPFSMLKDAFDSIAGILNIQILPHITLGVLIFTPLLVVIIIVVVKMFRG